MEHKWNQWNWQFILLFLLIAWTLLYQLDLQPMYLWDESRQANNALEMFESGNFAYPTYNGEPDFWNTKPHLLIAIQAVFFKILGPGLLALRLPSALAGIATVWLLFVFLKKYFSTQTGFLFVFIILTCGGFNTYHITRTGDYDALLLLFFALCITTFYKVIFIDNRKQKIAAFFIYLSLAILTKSLAAILWIPGFVMVYFVFYKERKTTILELIKYAWIPFIVVFGYYGYREWITPGYLQAVWDNEIAVRYFAPNEGHVSEWYYYLDVIVSQYFQWFWIGIPFVLLGMVFLPFQNKNKWFYFASFTLVFGILLSISKTRINWYLAPGVICLAMILAMGIGEILDKSMSIKRGKIFSIIVYTSIIFAGVVNWDKNWNTMEQWIDVDPQVVFKNTERTGKIKYTGIWLLGTYNPFELYYSKVLKKKNIQLRMTNTYKFGLGDTVIISHFDHIDSINLRQKTTQIHAPDKEFPVWVFRVDSLFGSNYRN